jgi:hypothetical protein
LISGFPLSTLSETSLASITKCKGLKGRFGGRSFFPSTKSALTGNIVLVWFVGIEGGVRRLGFGGIIGLPDRPMVADFGGHSFGFGGGRGLGFGGGSVVGFFMV